MLESSLDQRTQGLLTLRFTGLQELQASYMPYFRQGGLFVATARRYRLGDPVSASLTVIGHVEQLQISGHVAWITPAGAQGNRATGIGLHFEAQESVQNARQVLESLLSHTALPAVVSYTM